MLDLAISIDTDEKGTTIIETNHGIELKASRWPQDSDFQLVAFNPSQESCEVICAEELSDDIGKALKALTDAGVLEGRKPDWYRRLNRYAMGAAVASLT
jgi:hypothetical protein